MLLCSPGLDEGLEVQGELLLQDSFLVWEPKSLIRKGRDRHLFLFELSLIFSKEIKDSSGRTKYLYKSRLRVRSWRVGQVSDELLTCLCSLLSLCLSDLRARRDGAHRGRPLQVRSLGRTNADVRQQDGAEGVCPPSCSRVPTCPALTCRPVSAVGVIAGAEAGVGPQHPTGDPGEAWPPAGRAEGAHPPPQDPQPNAGTPAQHQPQVRTVRTATSAAAAAWGCKGWKVSGKL